MGIDKTMIQGSMGMLVLRLLEEKDMYGYEITDTLKNRSNHTFDLKAGSLYPLLHTLERKNYVTAYEDESSGKIRKYYSITAGGRKQLAEKREEWKEYSQAVGDVLSFAGGAVYDL